MDEGSNNPAEIDPDEDLSPFQDFIDKLDLGELPLSLDELKIKIISLTQEYFDRMEFDVTDEKVVQAIEIALGVLSYDEPDYTYDLLDKIESLEIQNEQTHTDYKNAVRFFRNQVNQLIAINGAVLSFNLVSSSLNQNYIGVIANVLLTYCVFLQICTFMHRSQVYRPVIEDEP